MNWRAILAGAVLVACLGCRIPTAEERAMLVEIGKDVAALTADIDEIAVEIKAVIEGAAAGEITPEDAAARLAALYKRRGGLEARLASARQTHTELEARGVNRFWIGLAGAAGVIGTLVSTVLGGKAGALKLVATGLSRVLEKAKAGKYADGDTRAELAKAGASPALAESVRREANGTG